MKSFKHLLLLALLAPVLALAAAGDYVDRSGTITTGGTSQQLVAADTTRGAITIYNLSTESEVLCVNVTSAASCSAAGSWHVSPGSSITLSTKEAVNIVAATTGHKFTAKERITEGFAAPNGSSGGGSGGAVTNAGTFAVQSEGKTAHDAVGTSTAPLAVGGYSSAAAPTDVSADGDVVRAWHLRNGAQAVQPTYGGTLAAGGAGVITAGTQRVTIASDDPLLASNTQLPADGTGQVGNADSFPVVISSGQMTATAAADANRMPIDERDALVVASNTIAAGPVDTTVVSTDTTGYGSIVVNVTALSGTMTLTYQTASDSGFTSALQSVACLTMSPSASSPAGYGSTATAATSVICPITNRYFRVRITTYSSGSVTADMILRKATHARPLVYAVVQNSLVAQSSGSIGEGSVLTSTAPVPAGLEARTSNITAVDSGDAVRAKATTVGALITKDFSIHEAEWNYAAAASGIVNTTTAVTVQSAQAAGIRNYVTGIDLMCEALTTATEIAIRDGAGGTVLWRTKVGTAGLTGGRNIKFPNPLRGSTATLLEVLTLTASGAGACYVNVSGYAAP